MSEPIRRFAESLPPRFEGKVRTCETEDFETLETDAATLLELLGHLKSEAEPALTMLTDMSGVDGLKLGWKTRFRVSYHLLAPGTDLRLRVRAYATDGEEGPTLPSATGLWKSADWNEREIWDLMGIRFSGHPDLRRILLTEDYELGHPLQKQIPTRGLNDDNR